MSTNSETEGTDERLWSLYREASLGAAEDGAPEDLRQIAREVAEKYLHRPYGAGLRAIAAAAWDEGRKAKRQEQWHPRVPNPYSQNALVVDAQDED